MTDLEKQPVPSESKCPECGGEPTPESIAEHKLSDIGYMHDDVQLECENCSTLWSVGIPIGNGPENEEFWCNSCDEEWMLIHRFKILTENDGQYIKMHMKCPNCYHFDVTESRKVEEDNVILTGYPHITGDVKDAKEWGWSLGDSPWGN